MTKTQTTPAAAVDPTVAAASAQFLSPVVLKLFDAAGRFRTNIRADSSSLPDAATFAARSTPVVVSAMMRRSSSGVG